MESSKNVTEQSKMGRGSANEPSAAERSTPGTSGYVGSAPQRAREIVSDVNKGIENAYDQTVKAVSEAYDKASEVLTETYDQTMTYGRQNPGKLTLIAFGAGIGVGALLVSRSAGRNRASRLAAPLVTALSELALAFFR